MPISFVPKITKVFFIGLSALLLTLQQHNCNVWRHLVQTSSGRNSRLVHACGADLISTPFLPNFHLGTKQAHDFCPQHQDNICISHRVRLIPSYVHCRKSEAFSLWSLISLICSLSSTPISFYTKVRCIRISERIQMNILLYRPCEFHYSERLSLPGMTVSSFRLLPTRLVGLHRLPLESHYWDLTFDLTQLWLSSTSCLASIIIWLFIWFFIIVSAPAASGIRLDLGNGKWVLFEAFEVCQMDGWVVADEHTLDSRVLFGLIVSFETIWAMNQDGY